MSFWKIGLGVIAVGALGWFGWTATRPIPGTQVAELGREHVGFEEVENTQYNSNPPTSGPHYEIPSKPGIYDAPQHDAELIHSLEHGYIIISYNCGVHLSWIGRVYAHEEGSSSADFSDTELATGSAINDSPSCKELIAQLTDLGNKKRLWKLIVVPRPGLDTTIALTAWGYIDKFDAFDSGRIERFIDFHRDHGPEKTMD